MTIPRLSIIIPTHNRHELVQRAVRSVIDALPDESEVIVIDDGSDPPVRDSLAPWLDQSFFRLLRHEVPSGAARARNAGAMAAMGEILLFLDDDDEMIADYPARVLGIATNCTASFGFSSIFIRAPGEKDHVDGQRPYPSGIIPSQALLRHRISAFSAGFWVRREAFHAIGMIDPRQVVDEDTSLCCALLCRQESPWYEEKPGVIVYRLHSDKDSPSAQLTQNTPDHVTTDCYLRSWQNYQGCFPALSEARWFLAARYLRRLAKTDLGDRARPFISSVRPRSLQCGLAGFWLAKRASRRLKRLI